MMNIKCCCCGRQIVNYNCKDDKYITSGPVTVMGCGKYSCSQCSEDLDENGLFPEERSQL